MPVDASIWIGGLALVVSIGTLIHGYFTLTGMAKKSAMEGLGDEVDRLKAERDEWRDHAQECERERQWLRREYMKMIQNSADQTKKAIRDGQ